MQSITIPASKSDAISQLSTLGGLVTASEWERAAIVYTFTEVSEGKGKNVNAASSISVTEFAKLGIVGLKSKDTVRKYHQAWADHPRTKKSLKPGDTCRLPKDEWPGENRTPRQAGATVPRIVAVLKDPEIVEEIVAMMSIADITRVINQLQEKVDASRPARVVREPGPMDTMVAIIDMKDAIARLKRAEPGWSTGVREQAISRDVAEKHLGNIEIIHDLMRIASDADAFEQSVPR